MATNVRSPVDETPLKPGAVRRIAARISEFSAVGPLVAESDLIVTLPALAMAWDLEAYGLVPLRPLMQIAPLRNRFFWSSRMANDPALTWIREIVLDSYRAAYEEARELVNTQMRLTTL